MLMNSLGYSSISMMEHYDGTFSEGKAVNAVGLLGAGGTVNILWTTNYAECCETEQAADVYFQRRLYMGVYPMAPLPDADHCIGANSKIEGWYSSYGGLFSAMQGKRWVLYAHAVEVQNGTAKVNAFELPSGQLIYPVVLEQQQRTTMLLRLHLNITGFEMLQPNQTEWTAVQASLQQPGLWFVTVDFGGTRVFGAAMIRTKLM
eukprot:TRINITY_DN5308_c0_g2_i1.p1 TRINITY_DN5308_c0_g2~~TRINITY_DN5308_c0_g2_i1.p1  ORF type:complete len:204 (+),score=49.38 TRINITY_DN5308_c0_g2_i1:219-830(+)